MDLKVGILVIGSLFWDDKKVRAEWRRDRLRANDGISVRAPIRYGRAARSRGYTYTMMLSMEAPPGHALVLPCQHNAETFEELLTEAEELWRAEALRDDNSGISANWGCVALKVRNSVTIPNDVLPRWAQAVHEAEKYPKLLNQKGETPAVNPEGLMQIPWPVKTDGALLTEVDVLLATTNEPSLIEGTDKYPTTRQIAERWVSEPTYKDYFIKNQNCGIKTFEDEAILEILESSQS